MIGRFSMAPTGLIAVALASCAAATPDRLAPPPIADTTKAQITVQHKFRIVGGGSGQVHDLFDVGTGVSFNASVHEDSSSYSHLIRLHEAVSVDLFNTLIGDSGIRLYQVMGGARRGSGFPASFDGARHPALVDDDIDESLIGKPLLLKIDPHRGGAVTNMGSFLLGPQRADEAFLSDPRGNLQRVKVRVLYDTHEDVLYRSITTTDRHCINTDTVYDRQEIDDFFEEYSARQRALRDRSIDFGYGEICGLVAPFPIEWNAYHVGSFPGFDEWTWQREPGTMKLYGIIGHQPTFADEIRVEAGRQYVGVYDPNNRSFIVRPLP